MISLGSAPSNLASFDDLLHSTYAPAAGAGGPIGLGALYTPATFGSATAGSLASADPVGSFETTGSLSGVAQSGVTFGDLLGQASGVGIPASVQAGTMLGGLGTQAALFNVPSLGQLVNPPCASSACDGKGGLLWCGPFGTAVCKESGLRLLVGVLAVLLLIAGFVGLVLPAARQAAPIIAKAAA